MKTMTTATNAILNPETLDGTIVEGLGFPMLQKMEGGKRYRLNYRNQRYGGPIFEVTRPQGNKVIVCHRASSIASSIEAVKRGDCLNGLRMV